MPRDEIDRITHENAMAWYRFDPFDHRRKEDCTVAALRAEVAGHDVSIRSYDRGSFRESERMGLGQLAQRATA